MATYHRVETCHSIHSRWSDSNSLWATIPLHTFAKPLAKFLHHREVTALLAKSRLLPFSAELLDLLAIYLESHEISSATKVLILRDLNIRAAQEGARVIVEENGLHTLVSLLESTDPDILQASCNVLANLAMWTSFNDTIVKLCPFRRLVSLVMHKNHSVCKRSLYTLSCLALLSEEAAHAVVAAGLTRILDKLFDSVDDVALYDLVNNLARHDSLKLLIAESVPYRFLTAAVEDTKASQKPAMLILLHISIGQDSACTFATESNLQWVHNMLDSPSSSIIEFACSVLEMLATHKSLLQSPVRLTPCRRLVSLVRHAKPSVAGAATFALNQLCSVNVGMDSLSSILLDRLRAEDEVIVQSSCRVLGNLAAAYTLNIGIINSASFQYLVSLMGKGTATLQDELGYALLQISKYDRGAEAVSNALIKAFASPQLLLGCAEDATNEMLCYLVGKLAQNEMLNTAIIKSGCCQYLVSLSGESSLRHKLVNSLLYISHYGRGAQATANAMVEALISSSQSSDTVLVCQLCRILGDTASLSSKVARSVEVSALIPLLLIEDSDVETAAVFMFQCIYEWRGPFTKAKVLHKLLQASKPPIVDAACTVVEDLAKRCDPFIDRDCCFQLVVLLQCDVMYCTWSRKEQDSINHSALRALTAISSSTQGATIIADSNALAHVTGFFLPRHAASWATWRSMRI
ncbi:hypothetical protein MVEN_01109000 [Mycena venus]|uniref:Vacuolar protein 8 n=1 Tax=Mycena venus TaxID=2733690 RepID=A0A8H6Y4U9_9AGAR|nr:hypothetical protein MVEN_01109000 [Mycena venus]